jgi:hypothetical protein
LERLLLDRINELLE